MKKPYTVIIVLMLLMNVTMLIVLFHQNSLLTEYVHRITNLEVRLEDIDDAIEGQVVPSLAMISSNGDWKEREVYSENGKRLLAIMPDPGLHAGKTFGYIFHFTEPFETFQGKELAIYAYHKESGEKITAVSPTIVTESTSGYPSLERFIASFELPKSGLWRYVVELDGEYYADVVLYVNEK